MINSRYDRLVLIARSKEDRQVRGGFIPSRKAAKRTIVCRGIFHQRDTKTLETLFRH